MRVRSFYNLAGQRRGRLTAAGVTALVVVTSGFALSSGAGKRVAPSMRDSVTRAADHRTWMEMRNVDLRINDRGSMRIQRLHAEVLPAVAGSLPVLDDPASFTLRITSATVGMTGADLETLLNDVVFAYRGAPLKGLKVRIEGDRLVQTGVMHKGVDIPFTITASLSLAADGRVRMHPEKMRIFGVNGTALMHALGLRLEKMLDLSGSRGAAVEGDDILLDVSRAVPPPRISGRLASVRIARGMVVQEFVRTADDSVFGRFVQPDTSAPNFVYFRGGMLRFGKLQMLDTDLQIIDADPATPFDLYLSRYARQLVAGYSKTLANQGLQAVMPDYAKVGAAAR
jgi:hypothetical protein